MVSIIRFAQLLALVCSGLSALGIDSDLSQRVLSLCSGQEPVFRSNDKRTLRWLLDASGEGSILLKTSPQHLAACWILYTDRKSKGRSKPKLLQRFALATLYYGTTRSNTTSWDWKMAVDVEGVAATKGHWMSVNRHECGWYGVVCDAWSNVIGLEMGWLALDGLIPRELGLLTKLQDLDLSACDLQGVLPHKMLAALSNLQYLNLHMNGFFGALHREVVGLRSLRELVAFGNYLGMFWTPCTTGKIGGIFVISSARLPLLSLIDSDGSGRLKAPRSDRFVRESADRDCSNRTREAETATDSRPAR